VRESLLRAADAEDLHAFAPAEYEGRVLAFFGRELRRPEAQTAR
jgi:hypothetical protein